MVFDEQIYSPSFTELEWRTMGAGVVEYCKAVHTIHFRSCLFSKLTEVVCDCLRSMVLLVYSSLRVQKLGIVRDQRVGFGFVNWNASLPCFCCWDQGKGNIQAFVGH
jgi:hypothetical protein